MKTIFVFCLSFLLSMPVFASKLPDFYKAGVSTTGNSARIGITGGAAAFDSAIPIKSLPGGWATAGNYGIPQAATGPTMTMSAAGDVFLAGTKYPFQAGYTVPASAVTAALGGLASVLGGPGVVLGVAVPFLVDWYTRAGVRVAPSDPTAVERNFDASVYKATCQGTQFQGTLPVLATSCASAWDPAHACALVGNVRAAPLSIYAMSTNGACPFGSWSVTPILITAISSWIPQSMADIEPYLRNTPYDPRVVPEILSKGGDISMPQPVVTGPSSVQGDKTETVNPDGTKTVTQTTYNFQTSGDTITNTSNNTVTTTYNTDNSVRNTSTTVVTPSEIPTDETKSECEKNPDSIGCSKFGDVPTAEKLNKKDQAVTVTAVDFGSSATCPAPLSIAAMGSTYQISYQPLCDQMAIFRALFMAMSAFLAAWILANSFKVS